jgi:hypothetical protein
MRSMVEGQVRCFPPSASTRPRPCPSPSVVPLPVPGRIGNDFYSPVLLSNCISRREGLTGGASTV